MCWTHAMHGSSCCGSSMIDSGRSQKSVCHELTAIVVLSGHFKHIATYRAPRPASAPIGGQPRHVERYDGPLVRGSSFGAERRTFEEETRVNSRRQFLT